MVGFGRPRAGDPAHSLSASCKMIVFSDDLEGPAHAQAIHLPDAGEEEEGEGGLAILRACAPGEVDQFLDLERGHLCWGNRIAISQGRAPLLTNANT